MASNTLKLLAQKAKKRLSTAGQSIQNNETEKTKTTYLSGAKYQVVANKQTIEDDPLFEKVKKLLEKEETFCPLAELTNQAVFDKLSSQEKERYIIEISKKYNEIKNYFLKEQNKNIA